MVTVWAGERRKRQVWVVAQSCVMRIPSYMLPVSAAGEWWMRWRCHADVGLEYILMRWRQSWQRWWMLLMLLDGFTSLPWNHQCIFCHFCSATIQLGWHRMPWQCWSCCLCLVWHDACSSIWWLLGMMWLCLLPIVPCLWDLATTFAQFTHSWSSFSGPLVPWVLWLQLVGGWPGAVSLMLFTGWQGMPMGPVL